MPTYAFRDKETGEVTEKFMGISAREEYLKQNPQLETMVNGAPMICDPVRVGARKMDTGFKEVLQKIHSRAPGSTLNQGSSQI
jgi:hypothetical protein